MAATKVGTFGKKLYIANLPWTIATRQLRDYFSQFGHISNAVVIFDKSTGMSKGFGFVTFSTPKSVNAVCNKTNHMLEGHTLRINTVEVPHQIE